MRGLHIAAGRLLPLCFFMLVHSILAAAEPARVAPPSAAKQAEVEQRIRSIFKAEYADRSLRGRVNLARRLLHEANSTTNDLNTS